MTADLGGRVMLRRAGYHHLFSGTIFQPGSPTLSRGILHLAPGTLPAWRGESPVRRQLPPSKLERPPSKGERPPRRGGDQPRTVERPRWHGGRAKCSDLQGFTRERAAKALPVHHRTEGAGGRRGLKSQAFSLRLSNHEVIYQRLSRNHHGLSSWKSQG
jgi:hypothetical protein